MGKVISVTIAGSCGSVNPPSPAETFEDAPWAPVTEVYDGIIRGEVSSIWYLNRDPTPTDTSDKSGAGHHPVWVRNERPSLTVTMP
jgi:hypothetical protein